MCTEYTLDFQWEDVSLTLPGTENVGAPLDVKVDIIEAFREGGIASAVCLVVAELTASLVGPLAA